MDNNDLSPKTLTEITEKLRDISSLLYNSTGNNKFTSFKDTLYGFDAVNSSLHMPEFEHHGYAFITRPRLNLTTTSLRQDRIMSMLSTLDVNTVNFAIRFWLDTNLQKIYGPMLNGLSSSIFVNKENPFIPVLTNTLRSLSGWPDSVLDVETSEGGFFSENITYPKGHDGLMRNYELQATFADTQGSVVLMTFLMWFRYMHLLTRGYVIPYTQDVEGRRMGFTSAIYRFVLDPSKRFITKWAKATGTFPRQVPLGNYFNFDSSASSVDASHNISIPFVVSGRIEYFDPIILKEFNMLIRRFCANIEKYKIARGHLKMYLNHKLIPYIDIVNGTNELQWRYDPSDRKVIEIINTIKRTNPNILKEKVPGAQNLL